MAILLKGKHGNECKHVGLKQTHANLKDKMKETGEFLPNLSTFALVLWILWDFLRIIFIFIFCSLFGVAVSVGKPRHPSPRLPPLGPLQGSWGIPKQAEKYNLSDMSWVCPGVSSQSYKAGTLPQGGGPEASCPDAQTTSYGSSHCGGAVALFWASAGSSPYLSGWAQPPCGVSSFWSLVFASLFFWSLHTVCEHRWSWDADEVLPWGSVLSSPEWTGTASTILQMPPQSISLTFHSPLTRETRYLLRDPVPFHLSPAEDHGLRLEWPIAKSQKPHTLGAPGCDFSCKGAKCCHRPWI